MPSYKLIYFPLRAKAEPIRMIFALAGVSYQEQLVDRVNEWQEFRKTTPYGFLPVLEVDGVPLAQSLAIMRYLAAEFGFYGKTNWERARVDSIAEQCMDFMISYAPWHKLASGWNKDGDKDKMYKEIFLAAKEKNFGIFQRALKENGTGFLVGDSLTYADLMIACRMESIECRVPEPSTLFDGYPEILAHRQKVFADPRLKEHLTNRPKHYPH